MSVSRKQETYLTPGDFNWLDYFPKDLGSSGECNWFDDFPKDLAQ